MPSTQLKEAIDFAFTHGLMKFNPAGVLTHAPICLTPYRIAPDLNFKLYQVTPLFNQLMIKVAGDTAWLKDKLRDSAKSDPFIQHLLTCMPDENSQPLKLLLSRNDFMLEKKPDGVLIPRQVEYNTIAASFAVLSHKVWAMHRYLKKQGKLTSELFENRPDNGFMQGLAAAHAHYGVARGCVAMIVQPNEANIFDQRVLEYRLIEQYEVPFMRLTLKEIAEEGQITEGHLYFRKLLISVVYFRAGYDPSDYDEHAWRARMLIEHSSAIKVPEVSMQLAGTKKIQQILSHPAELKRFVQPDHLTTILKTFVGLYALDDQVYGQPIRQTASQNPEKYVLKPQREGGGHNFFGAELKQKLNTMSQNEAKAYILMERINPPTFQAELVVDHQLQQAECVSEIGRFGVYLGDEDHQHINQDVGYLVRTKAADVNEGGVCAGYACLNSLEITFSAA